VNLSQARTELKARGFDYLSDSRLTTALNNAKNALEDTYPWPWLESTASGAPPLTASDLKFVQYVTVPDDDLVLVGVDARDIPDLDPNITTAGTAEVWWLDGTATIKTYPVTTKSLTVRYVKFSPELVNDADEPLIPVRYHPVWVDMAVVEAYKDSDNHEHANALLNDINARRLPAMLEVYAARNRQNPTYQTLGAWHSEDW
jgi:hypothetical protein